MDKSNDNVFSWLFPIGAIILMLIIVFIFSEGLFCKGGEFNFHENSIYKIAFCIFLAISIIVPIILIVFIQMIKANTENFERNKEFSGNSIFSKIWRVYIETFEPLQYSDKRFSRANADLYFTVESITNFFGIPLVEVLKIISGTFIGLGILGTFIGFSNAISADFSIQTIKTIEDLNPIFSGLQTAFASSIVGVFCSVIYNFFVVHPILQGVSDSVKNLSDDIDKVYYKSETEIIVSEFRKNDEKNANFVNSMNNLTNSLNTANSEFNKTVNNIRNLNAELKSNLENLQAEFKTEISKFTGKISSDLESGLKKFEESVNKFSMKINDSTLSITNSVDAVSKVPEKLEHIKEAFDGIVVKVSEQTTKEVGEIMEGVKEGMRTATLGVTDNLHQSAVQMKDDFKSISDNTNVGVSNCVLSVKEKFDEIALNIQNSLNQNVNDALGQMKEFVRESSETMREKVSKATVDMTNSVNEAVLSATEDVKNLNESLNGAVVKAVQDVDETAEKICQIPEKISVITESINKLDKDMVKVEKEFNANVNMISDIPERVDKFNETLKSYEEHVVCSLRDETEAASRGLKEITDSVKETMEVANSSASRFYDASQMARTVVKDFTDFLRKAQENGGENR